MNQLEKKQQHEDNRTLSESDINTLIQAGIIPEGTPTPQIHVFAKICQQHGLSPFSKEIHLVSYWSKKLGDHTYTSIIGIDGYRNRAASSGRYAGMSRPMFDRLPDGTYKTAVQLKQEKKMPISCAVIVYAIEGGQRVSYDSGDILFDEFNTGRDKWRTMPFHMIEKVAKTFALREGFPRETAGLHTNAELGAFEDAQKANPEYHAPIVPQGQKGAPIQSNNQIDLKEVEKACKEIYDGSSDPWTKNKLFSEFIRSNLDKWFSNNDAAAIGKKYRRMLSEDQKTALEAIDCEALQGEIDNIFASSQPKEEKKEELITLGKSNPAFKHHTDAKEMFKNALSDLNQ